MIAKIGKFFYLICGRLIEKVSLGHLSVIPTFLGEPFNQRATEYGWVLSNFCRMEGTKILDVGAGNSPFPIIVRRCGYEVIPIDKERFPNVIKVDATNLPWSNEYFDGITLISVIEHADLQTAKQIMNELSRVLKLNGLLFLTTEFSWNGERKVDEITIFTENSINSLLEKFLCIDVKYFSSIDKTGNRKSPKILEKPIDADGIMILAKPKN
jgi:hypothetical protein